MVSTPPLIVEDSSPELLMQIKLTFLNLAVAAHIAPVIKKEVWLRRKYGSVYAFASL